MIGALTPYLSRIRRSYQSNDIIDRLNYQYTAAILAVSCMTLTATQYVGKPIQCWVPPEFTGSWEKYAETYCFIKGSNFMPLENEIDDTSQREKISIQYYQWVSAIAFLTMRRLPVQVPLILGVQAFLFYFPSFVWKALNFNAGINVKNVLNSAATIKKKFDKGSRSSQVQKTASHIAEALEMQRDLKTSKLALSRYAKHNGIYLTLLYVATKLLYVVNIILQFVILNAFLGPEYTFWGWGVLNDIWNGRQWTESGQFPRVTFCDFSVRVLGNMHRWTVQCVLMINMFNEKIFIFFWFWFVFVGVLSVLSLFYWLFASAIHAQRRSYIAKYLRCTSAISEYPTAKEHELVDAFVRRFLRPDGVLLLRLIQTNGGDLLTGEIINAMYTRWRAQL